MVKNEADIIGETIANLFAQGVDHIVVADNGSADGTIGVLGSTAVHLLSDPIVEYWQGEKMSHLARVATRMGASWIVPFDADELWKGTSGRSVADVLRSSSASVVRAEWWDFVPLSEGEANSHAQRFPFRLPRPNSHVKVAFRANWLARIAIGNHSVAIPDPTVEDGLRIAHYRWRSPEQMIQKARDGTAAARKAGVSLESLPNWSTLEESDASDAASTLRQLVETENLVRDPAYKW